MYFWFLIFAYVIYMSVSCIREWEKWHTHAHTQLSKRRSEWAGCAGVWFFVSQANRERATEKSRRTMWNWSWKWKGRGCSPKGSNHYACIMCFLLIYWFTNCCHFPGHEKLNYPLCAATKGYTRMCIMFRFVCLFFNIWKDHDQCAFTEGIVQSSSPVLFWHCLLCPESRQRTSICLRGEAISLSRSSALLRLRRPETLGCVGPRQTRVRGDNKDETPRAPALEY